MNIKPAAAAKVLVTGASSGIGKETAMYLASQGVDSMTLFARGKEQLNDFAQEIAHKYPKTKVLTIAGDVSNLSDNLRAVEATVAEFGGLTSAFLNAGIGGNWKPLVDLEGDDIDDVFNVNVKGMIYGLKATIPAIKNTVGKTGQGSIVVNSSEMGNTIIAPKSAGASLYSASKAAVNSLVKSAAIENGPTVRVNAVLPGLIQTNPNMDDATYQAFGASIAPIWGRPGKASEIAPLVAFLLSDDASFISGSLITADGLWGMSDGKVSM